MKIMFRKAISVLGSFALVGATIGTAAAAMYPEPFKTNTAVVVGSGANPLDAIAAAQVISDLDAAAAGSVTTTINEDEAVRIEKSSDKLNLGDDASTVFVSQIDSDDLPSLLASGTYTDDDNTDYDYTQKINLGSNLDIVHFQDSDYEDIIGASDKTPSLGIQLSGDSHVLNYTLEFDSGPNYGAPTLETTELTIMGKQYYVLDVQNTTTNKTTLLDSASSVSITEGLTETVDGKAVSINFISSTEVKLEVNGQLTNSLAEGQTYKLSDGTYIGVKDISYNAKDNGLSAVEISIGSGKLELTHGSEIELNDDTVTGVTAFLQQDSSNKLSKIVISWAVDEESFVTPMSGITLPGFEGLKLSMTDFTVPEKEEVTVDFSGNDVVQLRAPIEDGTATIDLLKANTTGEFTSLGKDTGNRLFTTNSTSAVRFNESYGDKYFVASWNSTGDSESYYLKAEVILDSTVNKVRFTNQLGENAVKTVTNGSSASFGNVVITVNNITKETGDENFIMSLSSGGSLNTLYTKEGLKVYLPFESPSELGAPTTKGLINFTTFANATTGHNFDSFYLFFDEENKDEDVSGGDSFNLTLTEATDKVTVSAVGTDSSGHEIANSDNIEYYMISDLATRIVHNTGGDQDSVDIEYHGEQLSANLYLSAPAATGTGSSGAMSVTDLEVSTKASGKNLIVVGGSAINTIAAELLGGAYSEGEFTAMTGVGAGEFLVQSFTRGSNTALLVAGYNAADTTKGVTWLTNTADVKTDVGTKYKGTSATEATLVTGSA